MPWARPIRSYTRTCKSTFRARSNALRKCKTTLLVQAGFMTTGRQRGRLTLPGLLSGGSCLAAFVALGLGFALMAIPPSMTTAFAASGDTSGDVRQKLSTPPAGTRVDVVADKIT